MTRWNWRGAILWARRIVSSFEESMMFCGAGPLREI